MSNWYHKSRCKSDAAIDDRALQYGDGLFETIAIRAGEPRLWDRHLQRLAKGCLCLGIEMPSSQSLLDWLREALRQSGLDASRCIAKVIVSSGTAQRGYGRSTPAPAETYLGIFAADRLPSEHYRRGIKSTVCDTRLATFSATAGLKTLNRIEQVLASSERRARAAFEGLTLDADGRLICGTMSNVFIVSSNRIATPSLHRCGVAGVMREHTIDALHKQGVAVDVCDLSEAELWSSEEVFLTNSQFGVLPVRQCDENVWRSHPVTRKVMAVMANCGIEECAR